jgi:hypothetical protein
MQTYGLRIGVYKALFDPLGRVRTLGGQTFNGVSTSRASMNILTYATPVAITPVRLRLACDRPFQDFPSPQRLPTRR